METGHWGHEDPTGHGPSRCPLTRAQRGLSAHHGHPPHGAPRRGDRQKWVPVDFYTVSPTTAGGAARLLGSGTVAFLTGPPSWARRSCQWCVDAGRASAWATEHLNLGT